MMVWLLKSLSAVLFALSFGSALAQGAHSRADAVALAGRAAALLHQQPGPAALAAISDPHGAFVDGDLYVYVLDATDGRLTMLAHGANRALIGMPQNEIVDADGRTFNDETVAVVRDAGEGWVTYRWPNPVTRKIASKSSFVRLVDGMIVGVGIYQ